MRAGTYIVLLLLGIFDAIAQDSGIDIEKQIYQIKLDASYLYGESTMPDSITAKAQAFKILTEEIRSIKGAVLDTMTFQVLSHGRGQSTRVFAYVDKSALFPKEKTNSHDDWAKCRRKLETYLHSVHSFEQVLGFIEGYEDNRISYGEFDANTAPALLADSFIVVCQKNRKNVRMIYSPLISASSLKANDNSSIYSRNYSSKSLRRNILTGEISDKIVRTDTDIIFWIYVNHL